MKRALGLLLSLLILGACAEAELEQGPLQLSEQGLTSVSADGATLNLVPVLYLNDQRFEPGPCVVKGLGAKCPVSDLGTVHLETKGNLVTLSFQAEQDCTLNGLALEGGVELSGATSWLSNGYQSLSQSGMVALGLEPDEEDLREDLLAMGDYEALRDGRHHSWWYSLVGGGGDSLALGVTEARVFKSWISFYEQDNTIVVKAVSGTVGEAIPLKPSQEVSADPWYLALGGDAHGLLEEYAAHIVTRKSPDVRPQVGWNSWYELGDTVTEDDVRANAQSVRTLYENYEVSQPLRIVVDDGWQIAWGEWLPNEKFPSGMNGLAADLKADGFDVGIWLAPLLISEESTVFKEHPEWLVEGATWGHPIHGSFHVLDITKPEAAAHLQQTISQVVSWGYDFLKIDFLAAGSLEGGHHQHVTGMQHLDQAMALIREAAGEDVTLLAVIAPPIAPFPYVDAWRVGNDICYPNVGPRWPFIPNQLRSIGVRWPMCIHTMCDADPPLLRELKEHQVQAGAWVIALAGGAMFLSDDIPKLDAERWTWGLSSELIALATAGEPARPLDLFPVNPPERLVTQLEDIGFKTSTHVTPIRWRFSDGTEVVFNVSDDPIEIDGITLEPHSSLVLTP